MKVVKMLIGDLQMITKAEWKKLYDRKEVDSEIPDNMLGEQEDIYVYDADPDKAGDIVPFISKEGENTTVNWGGQEITVPNQFVEEVKEKTFTLNKILNSKPVKKREVVGKKAPKERIRKSGFISGSREEQIKNCTKEGCNGNPVLVTFELSGFTGIRCAECFIIKEYKNK